MLRALSLIECQRMVTYFDPLVKPVNLRELKEIAIRLMVTRMCICIHNNHRLRFQHIIHRRCYKSRNSKNIQLTRRLLLHRGFPGRTLNLDEPSLV
jgi:hypothetical protein